MAVDKLHKERAVRVDTSTGGFRSTNAPAFVGKFLVMTGINLNETGKNEHVIVSDDKKAAVWAGTIDDLCKLGKPTGHGAPWKNGRL